MKLPLEAIEAAIYADAGLCIMCGVTKELCEPDACAYRCDECGRFAVYGAEEILLMGMV